MRAFSLILVLLALTRWSSSVPAYGSYGGGQGGYDQSYTSSSYTSSSSSSSSSSSHNGGAEYDRQDCCALSAWANAHIDEVRQVANRFRQEYNNLLRGVTNGYLTPWRENVISLTGKTASELDAMSNRWCDQLVNDVRSNTISRNTIAQPNYFEWRASSALQSMANMNEDLGQQQQQELLDVGQLQVGDLTNYDEVKSYAYPSEVKMINGKMYVVHKNCTEAKKTSGEGTFENPLVSIYKRNDTIITTNSQPGGYGYGGYGTGSTTTTNQQFSSGSYGTSGGQHYPSSSYGTANTNQQFSSGSLVNGMYHPAPIMQPGIGGGGSTSTLTHKKTIYDWVNHNMEPSVVNYSPMVTVGSNTEWGLGNRKAFNPVVIPVEGVGINSNVETFNTGSHLGTNYAGYNFVPGGSIVTVKRFNKTIITNPDGTIQGSESNKKWINGVLVEDSERPFGEWSVPRDSEWKREERERFFWLLSSGSISAQRLEDWQRQQEERLLALAQRYHTSLDEIHSWHRAELERFRLLLGQYQAQSTDTKPWQRMERGRLDWLIHQNSVTREELERWQRENQDKLAQLAQQYQISIDELKAWQIQELNRLYVYFNDQNNSMISRPATQPGSASLHSNSEKERLEALIRQHNATISQLQNSIKLDQQKLVDLSQKYRGNVQDMEQWLKGELTRLTGIIKDQRTEMTRVSEWQHSERQRLEDIVKQHRGSIGGLEAQMAHDRTFLQALAAKYHVSIEELEKWQRTEIERLHREGQSQLELNIKEWQRREHENLMNLVKKNDLTIEEFQSQIMNDKSRLQNLANTYKLQVSEVEDWIKKEIKNFQSQGLLKEVEKELAIWQQKERERLLSIVQQNELTIDELQAKIKGDQSHLYQLANSYQVHVEEIEEWLKKELLRLQSQGLIKVEDLKDWQKQEREGILKIVQQNRYTIEEFEKKLLQDRARLAELSKTYNVQTTEIENWIKQEGERLQNLGLLKMQEQLNNWQKTERDRLLILVQNNNLTISELEEKIKSDKSHLFGIAQQHQVRVEEVEEWIKKEIKRLQEEGLIEIEKLKDWQTEWRGNLTNMVRDRDLTVEQFHKWLLEDRSRLQALAMQHNVQIEEIEQWVKNEEQRFVSMGLLKPNEKLTNWQEIERRYLERITQEQYHSTEQLEERLREDRLLLEKLAHDYSVQVEEIEQWMKKELSRLRDEGQLQIDNLTSWQIAERERLEALTKENKQWSVEEFEAILRNDREHMQKMAFQYHTSVEEIEKWIKSEVERLQQQGKLDIAQMTAWQKTEHQRILNLLHQQSGVTVEQFERKLNNDRQFLQNLANQYHISVIEVEEYVKKVIDELRQKGKFEVENLQQWQVTEREYIKQLIAQYNNGLTTKEFEDKLRSDRVHLKQLSDQYRLNIDQIEKWMIAELKRLRQGSENQVNQMAAWQVKEVQRIKELIQSNNRMTYVQFEVELMKERERLRNLALQYSISVEELEKWLRQQLINLKTTGQVEVENLTVWQEGEQKRLIDMLLQQQHQITMEEFEAQLRRDRHRLQNLSNEYHVSVEQIETWMRDELQRLKQSGLVQVEQLTQWQKNERDRLQDWLKQQNNKTTYEEFNAFLKRDNDQLQRISQDYQVTVQEIESWVQQEAARLQLLGFVQQPESLIQINTWEGYNNNNNNNFDMNDMLWKEHTAAHLRAIASVKPMNWEQFEQYLRDERMRWEQFARQHNITVEQIEVWLREKARELMAQGVIQAGGGNINQGTTTVTIEQWHIDEQQHIQNLINDMRRKQQVWTIDELERHLKQDHNHIQRLAIQYKVTVEQIEQWYKQELQRRLQQNEITAENLTDWQKREKNRIYWVVISQPLTSIQVLEHQLLDDRTSLNRLADEYHVSIEELEMFIRKQLNRLVNIGLVSKTGGNSASASNLWQEKERKRLRTIAQDLTITEEELLEFIAGDVNFQNQLANSYGVGLDQLAPFQRIEIAAMQRQNLLDNTKLLQLQTWQKRERDNLYRLIKNQNFSLKNLQSFQRQQNSLVDLAQKYGIDVQTLKDFQLKEFQRFQQLTEQYKLSLQQLQDFREKELRYILFYLHKYTSSEGERMLFERTEANRMQSLSRMTGLSGQALLEWRRRLYLLCQGLLPMDVSGNGSANSGGTVPNSVISKDRGDQPPNIYYESMDGEEPAVMNQNEPMYPLPSAEMKMPPNSGIYLPPNNENVQSGYRYTKKDYHFTVPSGSASASATVNSGGGVTSSASATQSGGYYNNALSRGERNEPQQQQEVDDFGQQQQVELAWNANMKDGGDDAGQQQQQFEEHYTGGGGSSHYAGSHGGSASHYAGSHGGSASHYAGGSSTSHNGGSSYSSGGSGGSSYSSGSSGGSSAHYGGAAHGSYTNSNGYGSSGSYGQQQQQVDDFGLQQQVELGDYKQHDYGQQQEQVEVEDLSGTFTTKTQSHSNEKQVAPTSTVEVQAEEEKEPGFFGKWKKKIFG